MNTYSLSIILGSVLLTTVAQIALKIASSRYAEDNRKLGIIQSLLCQFMDPLTIAATIAYAVSFALWFLALRQLPLSTAYSFSGLTIALVTISSILFLNETPTTYNIIGIIFIITGVFIISIH